MGRFGRHVPSRILAAGQRAIAVLEPYVAGSAATIMCAALHCSPRSTCSGTTRMLLLQQRLIESATKDPGPQSLHGLARIVWLHHKDAGRRCTSGCFLLRLKLSTPDHLGTGARDRHRASATARHQRRAVGAGFPPQRSCRIPNSKSTISRLSARETGQRRRTAALPTGRSMVSSPEASPLCDNVSDLVGIDKKRAFDTTVQTAWPHGGGAGISVAARQSDFLFIKAGDLLLDHRIRPSRRGSGSRRTRSGPAISIRCS